MRGRRHYGAWWRANGNPGPARAARIPRRGTAALSAVAIVLLVAAPAAGTARPASISWSRAWSWLTGHSPSLRLPVQATGTARGTSHTAPASATRTGRGTGRRPGHGAGQLPLFSPHAPGGKTSASGPGFGNGSHSFNSLTSRRVPSNSSATSTLFRNADGTYTRRVYAGPVNYRAPDGTWQLIDAILRPGTDGRFHETANSLSVGLAATASDPDLVTIGLGPGQGSVSYGLRGAAAVRADVSGSTATYAGVLPATDLVESAVGSGLQESLVLRAATAPASWVFPLRLNGLSPRLAADGSVEFLNPSGTVAARVPRGSMRDSSVSRRSGGPAGSSAVSYQLVTSGGQPALRMSVDTAWLRSPARVFPVTVDPSLKATATGTTYAYLPDTGDNSSSVDMLIGTFDSGANKANSFLAFSGLGSALSGQRITSAYLHLFDEWAATCTAEPFQVSPITQSWPVTGLKTFPGPSFGSSIGSLTAGPGAACTNTGADPTIGTWMTVGLSTGTFNSWTTGGADNGLAVWASDSDSLQWKRFDADNSPNAPYLELNYTPDLPPQIDSQYPPDNYNSPALTPELIASGHDPDNWPSPIKYNFTVYSSSGSAVASSGNISASDWVVPAGKLSWSQTYYWSVQAYDGYDYSAAVTANYFSTVVPQPLITSSLAQNTGGHGFDQSIGNYTTSATDANVQTAGPSLSVDRAYNSLDPRVSGAFGAGWSSVYDMKATEVDDASGSVTSVVITYPDGQQVGFGKDSNGTFAPPQGRYATLKALANHTGYTLTDKNDTMYTFGQAGSASNAFAVSSIADYFGRTETFTYSGGEVATVTSGVSGRALHFTWATPAGAQHAHVTSVSTDPATPGNSSTALTWTYSYTGDELTAVCPPTSPGSCTTYSYTAGSHFPAAVLDSGPHSYWRMGETSGTTAASSVTANEGSDNGTYSNVTLGQPGPLPGSSATSASFNGTSSYLSLPSDLVYQSSYATISMWFKTTSTSAGMLFSTGHSAPGTPSPSGLAMPVLYVGSDGKLHGHFWDTTVPGMSSPGKVNDGSWHYVVLTSAGSTQLLYLDGAQVGTLSGQVADIDPLDMIGTGVFNNDGWPAAPTGIVWNHFSGSIGEVALYHSQLTAAQAGALYAAGHSAASLLDKVTAPAGNVTAQVSYDATTSRVTSVVDNHGATWSVGAPKVTGSSEVFRSAVMGAAPAGYWRLGDTGSPTQAYDEVKGGYGQYSTVTLGASGPFKDETAASFNGTSSSVSLPDNLVSSTTTLSVGLWFKTSSSSAGMLFSTGHSAPGTPSPSSGAMPVLYAGSDGKLYGHFWNGTVPGMSSPGKVNDGNWHFVVLSGSGTSQALYLDGRQVGTLSGQIANTDPLEMIGTGVFNDDGWPAAPTGIVWNHFNGSVGEVALYHSQLTAAQVQAQWAAYKSSSGVAPVETVSVIDPGGKTLTYAYDPRNGGRLLSQADGLGNKTSYGYDTSGYLHTVTDPDGDVTTTGHDVRGNVVSQVTCQNQAANNCSTEYYTYYPDDTSANPSADPRDDLVLTMRDGRSLSATDSQYLTSYTYDSAGNQTSVTTPPVAGFPAGRTTKMAYSTSTTPAAGGGSAPAGLLASATSPGGGTEILTYYQDGDPATVTDPAGEVTTYRYDGLGRVTAKTVVSNSYPAGLTTAYTYDGQNQPLTQTDAGVTDHVTGAVHTAQTTNSYDADGNLTSVTVADLTGGDAARTTKYSYTLAADELASSTNPQGAVTSYAYDGYGNKIKEVDAAGDETDYTYDPNGHLLTTTLAGYTGDPASPSSPASLVEESRAYDPAGRLASITDSMGRVTAYAYTDNGLLASITRQDPATGQSFVQQSNTYDAAGNLIQRVSNNGTTTTSYTDDAADRTASSTVDPSGLDRTTTYAFSPDDFVLNVTRSDGSGATTSTDASYDPLGRMTSQTVHNDSAGHPAGWWPLTATSGTPTYTADTSGSGHTGAVSGAVSLSSGGATFNGSSGAVSLPDNLINSHTTLSVSLWFETTAASTGTLFSTGASPPGTSSPSDDAMPVLYVGSDGKLHGHFWTTTQNVPGISSPGVVNDGKWHHVVLSGAGTSQALYLDGTQVGTLSAPLSNIDPLNMVGAGVYNNDGWPAAPSGDTWNYFTGQIADVQLYYRALSASDTAALHADGRSGGALGASPLTTAWALDQRGLPTSMTDPNGNTTSYLYDEAGKLADVIAPTVSTESGGGAPVASHPVTTYGYDTFGDRVSSQDPDGNITTTGYDADGQPVSQTLPSYTPPGSSSPITATSTRAYNSLGQAVSATDPLGNVTASTYDQLGDLATVTDPAGGVTHHTYDTNGDRLSVTNPAGAQSQATYDYLGRQLTATQIVRQPAATADTTTNGYADAAGLLSSTTTPAGVITSYTHDAAGETTKVTDGAGNATSYAYDLLGRKIVTTLPDGTSQHLAYDEAGHLTGTSDLNASGSTLRSTSAAYDGNGQPTSVTDAMGAATTFSYDATGMLTQEVQPVSATSSITTSFGYDAAGNQTRYTNGNGNATIAAYNTWNLPESTIVPATPAYPSLADRTFTTAYNAAGQVAQRTSPGGVTVTDSYDALGRLTSQSGTGADAPTATRSFGYDAVGNVTSASTPAGTAAFSYDDRGLLLSASGPSGSSSLRYNGDGNMTARTDASGTSTYAYDSAGRLSTLTDAATGSPLTYGYNSDSQLTSVSYGAGGASQQFAYNSLHQLTVDTLTSPAGQAEASISYGYNLNGDETSKTTTGVAGSGTNSYSYDEANRLTSWNNGTATVSYGYDANGNRTQAGSQTFSYDARDELTSGGGVTHTYTARGTQASATSPAGTTSSTSDAFNQVITDGPAAYTYDALGRVLTSQGHTFAYSGLANDVASDGVSTYSRDPSGNLVAVAQGGASVLALTDQHKDVVGEFTAAGSTLSGSATYDPLGNVTAASSQIGSLGYQSGWTDPATGKVNMASRWYNPATGQFTSRDAAVNSPVPASAAANTFAYGQDNPLTAYDPLGTCDWWNPVCGIQQAASNIGNAVSSAWNDFTGAVSSAWNNVSQAAQYVYHQAAQAVTNFVSAASHVVTSAASWVSDAWQNTWQAASNVWTAATHVTSNAWHAVAHAVYNGAGTVWQTTTHVVYATFHAVKYVAQSAAHFVQNHAAAIVSFVASTAVFVGCEAAITAVSGATLSIPGAIACGALSGAVGGAINYAMSTPMSKWTLGGFALQVGIGAAVGAAGGLLGAFGGKLLGPVLKTVASRLGVAALDDAASAGADAGASALDSAGGDAGSSAGGDAASATSAEPSPSTSAEPSTGGAQEEPVGAACGGMSFAAGTAVLLASGGKVAISKLRVGQKVLATNTRTGRTTAERISAVLVHHDTNRYDLKVSAGHHTAVIDTTSNHLFWDETAGRWVKAAALRYGAHLRTASGGESTVLGGEVPRFRVGWMWDLTVASDHDFYVTAASTAVLVHNCSRKLGLNLKANGDQPSTLNPEAHHIVPENHLLADPARNILSQHGIDIDSADNGVWLGHDAHRGTFTNDYVRWINDEIVNADQLGGKAAVLSVISNTRQELLDVGQNFGNGL
jgi:RHS repeat-associated protein